MTITSTATTVPLTYKGLTSDRYTGTTREAVPTPNPTISLPKIKSGIDPAVAINIAPIVKSTSAKIRIGFLPNISYNVPANKAAKKAPNYAIETMISF